MSQWRRYLRFWGNDLDADLADEFRFHLDTEIEELVARGMTPEEARADALKRFGDVAHYRAYCRRADGRRTARARRAGFVDVLAQDIRYALRSLWRQPTFTLLAVLTLGLGIGANTAIFSVVNGVMLTPLPYHEPDRLVLLWESVADAPQIMVSYPDYVDWRARSHSFEDLAIYNGYDSFNATGAGDPERIHGGLASGNLFTVLGVQAAMGRLIDLADDHAAAAPVVVLSDKLWKRKFAADRRIVGKSMTLDGTDYTITGVLPPEFNLAGSELWLPLGRFTDSPRFVRDNHPGLLVIGRLRAGVTVEQMRADMTSVANQLQKEHRENEGIGVGGMSYPDFIVGDIKPALMMLSAAVGLVLLVACANVANLLLGRAATRQREFALRVAIGAKRGRIVRQLLTESIVLSLLGGIVGVALAWAGVKLLLALNPSNVPRLSAIGVSLPVLAFALGISVFTGVIFGLVPALHATRSDPIDALKEGSRGAGWGVARSRLRASLTVAEVGLAVVLLMGAGLLLRSFMNLLSVDPGFDKRGVVGALIQLPDRQYPEEARRRAFFEELMTKVRALPEVSAASLATDLPIASSWQTTITYDGAPPDVRDNGPLISAMTVSPDFFRTVGVGMIAGRDFAESDRKNQTEVAVISRSLAMRFFATPNAVGRRIKQGRASSPDPWVTVVGVVNDIRNFGLQTTSPGQVYFPAAQSDLKSAWVLMRSDAPPETVGPALRSVLTSMDRELPLALLQTLEHTVDSSIAQPRFSMVMLVIFASIALILAAVGVYGVISYSVAQRTREIGVRIALGAQRASVLRMIVRQGMTLAVVGVVLGGCISAATRQVIARHLYGVGPSDPAVFAVVTLVLLGIAFAASVLPAVRAMRIDPVEAMRGE